MHLIYWGNQYSDDAHELNTINNMFASLSGTPWQALLGQYGVQDETLIGSVIDPTAPPQDVDTIAMLREVQKEQAAQGWSNTSDSQFIVFLPPGQQSSYVGNNCGVHTNEGGYVMAAVINNVDLCSDTDGNNAEDDNATDSLTMTATHEYAEAATDPDTTSGWRAMNSPHDEVGDPCAHFAGDTIAGGLTQALYDNRTGECQSH